MILEGRVAAVTGAAQNIGKAIAMSLAGEGAQICVLDINLREAEATAEEINERGGRAVAHKVNIADFDEVMALVPKVLDSFDAVDILVNNAGITRDNLLARMSEDEWDSVMAVNLKGAFNCCRAFCRPMIRQRGGRIVNIASVIGLTGNTGQSNYAASKAGMIGLTKSIARELAPRGITVNAVAPGFIDTAMTQALGDTIRENLLSRVPIRRLGHPEDVAAAVTFLASDRAAYITGQVLNVDGGMVM
ncbi:MAG: 3-oxoacyl-[acyl-carrier-protein] reductase [Candidatus Eisenbacteria sp.]|nr:3-oxoacyl-[acyl-carrier-protein] reductase [Candidatus Eisenbacteria bacterium]